MTLWAGTRQRIRGQWMKRDVTIELGKVYIISPMNPQRTRNRGRQVQVVDIEGPDRGDYKVTARYRDTGRWCHPDPAELVPIDGEGFTEGPMSPSVGASPGDRGTGGGATIGTLFDEQSAKGESDD